MNHIEQAYQQGVSIRCKGWGDDEWIKKHSETESIAEDGKIYLNTYINFDFNIILAVVVGMFLHISTTIIFETNENHKFNVMKLTSILIGCSLAFLMH